MDFSGLGWGGRCRERGLHGAGKHKSVCEGGKLRLSGRLKDARSSDMAPKAEMRERQAEKRTNVS